MFDIAVSNGGDEEVTWRQAQSDFSFPPRRSEPPGLVIGREDEIIPLLMENNSGCARTENGIIRDSAEVTTSLEPGERIEQRYAIAGLDGDLDDPCPEMESYRAEWNYGTAGVWGIEFKLDEVTE